MKGAFTMYTYAYDPSHMVRIRARVCVRFFACVAVHLDVFIFCVDLMRAHTSQQMHAFIIES